MFMSIYNAHVYRPTQQPDGSEAPEDIPPPQILRELQPEARFLLTLSDPVRRTYSDYNFLNDDRTVAVVRPGRRRDASVPTAPIPGVGVEAVNNTPKSPQQFHERIKQQIFEFNTCVTDTTRMLKLKLKKGSAGGTEQEGGLHEVPGHKGDIVEGVNGVWFRASQM